MKTRLKFILPALLAAAAFLQGCEKEYLLPQQEVEIDSSLVISFSTDIIPILGQYCATSGCHDGAHTPNLTASVAYDQLNAGGYILSGDPDNSQLIKIIDGSSKSMPPSSKPQPSGENIAYIKQWIKQGAENN